MGYGISFVRFEGLNESNVEEVFADELLSEHPEQYLSLEFRESLMLSLRSHGLRFEAHYYDQTDSLELDFGTFDLRLYSTQIGLSIPYWDSNNEKSVMIIISQIISIIVDFGLVGHDPQCDEFIRDTHDVELHFGLSKAVVDAGMKKLGYR